jgi:hypothetical protein
VSSQPTAIPFAKDLDFFLQIPNPLLRGGKLTAISITQTTNQSLLDALLALPSVQARFSDPKTSRDVTNSAPFVK